MLQQNETYLAYGKVGFFMGKPQIVHPELEVAKPMVNGAKSYLEPIYSTTEKLKARGLGARQIGKLTETLFLLLHERELPENLPEPIVSKLKLMPRYEAYRQIHFPASPLTYAQHPWISGGVLT